MDYKADQVRWLQGAPTEYASSASIRRGFCAHCGSSLTYRSTAHPDYLTLAIASLDDPDAAAPNYHIHTASQVSWLAINDSLPKYPGGRTES